MSVEPSYERTSERGGRAMGLGLGVLIAAILIYCHAVVSMLGG